MTIGIKSVTRANVMNIALVTKDAICFDTQNLDKGNWKKTQTLDCAGSIPYLFNF